jgi:hypothetical protein
VAWVFLPGKGSEEEKLSFHALVRPQEGGPETLADAELVTPSTTLPSARPGRVVMRRLGVPPGNYTAALAVTGEKERPLASATLPLRIPALDKEFAVSSLLLTAGVGPVQKDAERVPFVFGTVEALPRADAEFARTESLWYFVQLANVDDKKKITQELQLRRGAQTIASQPPMPAKLQELAPPAGTRSVTRSRCPGLRPAATSSTSRCGTPKATARCEGPTSGSSTLRRRRSPTDRRRGPCRP